MTLQDLGAIGELFGGLAVLFSVVYLALQIRQTLAGYRSTVTQEVTNHFSLMQLEVARDAELWDLWMRAQSGGELTNSEMQRARQILSSYLIAFENLFYQFDSKMLDADAWQARRGILGQMMSRPLATEYWETTGRAMHPERFSAEVDRAIAEASQ